MQSTLAQPEEKEVCSRHSAQLSLKDGGPNSVSPLSPRVPGVGSPLRHSPGIASASWRGRPAHGHTSPFPGPPSINGWPVRAVLLPLKGLGSLLSIWDEFKCPFWHQNCLWELSHLYHISTVSYYNHILFNALPVQPASHWQSPKHLVTDLAHWLSLQAAS